MSSDRDKPLIVRSPVHNETDTLDFRDCGTVARREEVGANRCVNAVVCYTTFFA